MKLPGWLGKARKIVGKITDYLLIGRNAGWWQKKGPDFKGGKK